VLRFFSELDRMQVGDVLGISANYVGVLQNRAIARLRRDAQLAECVQESWP
jgi:DNA-directed RNA polymerase specialized sigma subunit